MGFYKNHEQNAAAIEGDWLHTGDIAIINDEKSLSLID